MLTREDEAAIAAEMTAGGWRELQDKPPEGAKVMIAHLWVEPCAEPVILIGRAQFKGGAFRNHRGGVLDSPSWWHPE